MHIYMYNLFLLVFRIQDTSKYKNCQYNKYVFFSVQNPLLHCAFKT